MTTPTPNAWTEAAHEAAASLEYAAQCLRLAAREDHPGHALTSVVLARHAISTAAPIVLRASDHAEQAAAHLDDPQSLAALAAAGHHPARTTARPHRAEEAPTP